MNFAYPFPWVPDYGDSPRFQLLMQENFEAFAAGKKLPWPYEPGDFARGSFEERLLENFRAIDGGSKVLPWPLVSGLAPAPASFEERVQQNFDRIARYLKQS